MAPTTTDVASYENHVFSVGKIVAMAICSSVIIIALFILYFTVIRKQGCLCTARRDPQSSPTITPRQAPARRGGVISPAASIPFPKSKKHRTSSSDPSKDDYGLNSSREVQTPPPPYPLSSPSGHARSPSYESVYHAPVLAADAPVSPRAAYSPFGWFSNSRPARLGGRGGFIAPVASIPRQTGSVRASTERN